MEESLKKFSLVHLLLLCNRQTEREGEIDTDVDIDSDIELDTDIAVENSCVGMGVDFECRFGDT